MRREVEVLRALTHGTILHDEAFHFMRLGMLLERVTGEKVPYRMAARRPGDPARLVASNDRLRDVLGWRPAYTEIDAVVETAWKWHRAHPNGYGD